MAQDAVFQVVDGETEQDLDSVIVHSRYEPNRDGHLRTDVLGRVKLFVSLNDTISFERKGYFPLHLVVTHLENYDFLHPLRVKMIPLIHHHQPVSIHHFTDLKSFDHHFAHHEDADKSLKIKVLEDNRASEKRKSWVVKRRATDNQSFTIIDVKIPTGKRKN
ncbi:MAG: hypothetical protein MUE85_06710 [Microscillaceae bacterium]|nr:hypothetical protein [Microscillaceae bacterium]